MKPRTDKYGRVSMVRYLVIVQMEDDKVQAVRSPLPERLEDGGNGSSHGRDDQRQSTNKKCREPYDGSITAEVLERVWQRW